MAAIFSVLVIALAALISIAMATTRITFFFCCKNMNPEIQSCHNCNQFIGTVLQFPSKGRHAYCGIGHINVEPSSNRCQTPPPSLCVSGGEGGVEACRRFRGQ